MGFPQPLLYQLRLSLSGDRFACVFDSFAGLLAHSAELFLYLATGSLGFTLPFKVSVSGHLTNLAFDSSLDLFSFPLTSSSFHMIFSFLELDWSDAAFEGIIRALMGIQRAEPRVDLRADVAQRL